MVRLARSGSFWIARERVSEGVREGGRGKGAHLAAVAEKVRDVLLAQPGVDAVDIDGAAGALRVVLDGSRVAQKRAGDTLRTAS